MAEVEILDARDPDCLLGAPWGHDRLKEAVCAFNEALGLEHPQYVLQFCDGKVMATITPEEEDKLPSTLDKGYVLGMEQAMGDLLNASAQDWRDGNDDKAKWARDAANKLKAKVEEYTRGR